MEDLSYLFTLIIGKICNVLVSLTPSLIHIGELHLIISRLSDSSQLPEKDFAFAGASVLLRNLTLKLWDKN